VADSALMLKVITGPDPRDRYSIPAADFDYVEATAESIKGLKIAYSEDWGYAPVDPEVRRVVSEAVKVFETDLGCTVERADPGWEDPFPHFWPLVAADTDLVGMRRMMKGHEHEMSPHLVDLLNRNWTAEDFSEARHIRRMVCNKMWRFMAKYDLLLTPTLAVPAFPLYMQGPEIIEGRMVSSGQWLCFTFITNLTGQPTASIPAGFTKTGLPVGLQIIGRHLADRTVLAASGAFERARPWAHAWPKLVAELGL
jgi:aspartyl-tRNA(Asn)/glutamyl-tRNA(Gln) amidotransferase subunit A